MRKIILIFGFTMISFIIISAQSNDQTVSITDLVLTPHGQNLDISFKAEAGKRVVKSNYTLILTPILTNGAMSFTMPNIIISGRNATISEQRRTRSNTPATLENMLHLRNGDIAEYFATIPYQNWMEGSALTLNQVSKGCCNISELPAVLLADNISIIQPELKPAVPIIPEPIPQNILTTGDRLAKKYPYVLHNSQYKDEFTDERYAIVYFKQGKTEIDPLYRNNEQRLNETISVIKEITASKDSKVVRIVIVGFASPEGPETLNNHLAQNRALVLKKIIENKASIPEDIIKIHNGGEDWIGLRKLVAESDMKYKDLVLKIIDETPIWDSKLSTGRMKQLLDLKGGEPYRYMFDNFFPDLRNAAYIGVYYENIIK